MSTGEWHASWWQQVNILVALGQRTTMRANRRPLLLPISADLTLEPH